MALPIVTVQPNTAVQLGTVAAIVGGAANAAAAVSDGSNTTYLSFPSQARLDTQVVRLGFPLPTLPTGSKIYSVTLRQTVQSVVTGTTPPVCNHWFRTLSAAGPVAGQSPLPSKAYFTSSVPVSQTVSAWTTLTINSYLTAPDGSAWSLTNLATFTYDLGRGDSNAAALNVSEVFLDVQYQNPSTVTVTAPTGTVTSTRPTVTHTYSSLDSQPQASSRVCIYTQAQTTAAGFTPMVTTPLQDSGTLLGEGLAWTLTADLTDGQYVAYVQVTARWSGPPNAAPTAMASSSWTRAATPASPPPAASFTSATFDAPNNQVPLTFAPGGTTPATTAFTVQVSRNGGVTYTQPPSLSLIPANGMTPITVYDNFPPLNVTSLYQIIAYSGSPYVAAVSPSTTLSVTTWGDQHWLTSASNPLLKTPLPVAAPKEASDGIKITRRRTEGIFYRLSAPGSEALPFVVKGPTHGEEYAIEAVFMTPDELNIYWPIVDELDRTGGTMMFTKPDGTYLWVSMGSGGSGQDPVERYDGLPGSPEEVFWRRFECTLTQVPPPAYY